MEFVLLAGRNLWKHGKRSLLVLVAIALGGGTIVVLQGYLTYTYWGIGRSSIHDQGLGHVQIYREGFSQYGQKEPGVYVLEPEDTQKLLNALGEMPDVAVVSPRLGVSGLISDGENSIFFSGTGVNPELDRQIKQQTNYIGGEGLSAERPFLVTVGSGIYRAYGIGAGTNLTVLATTHDGILNAVDVTVGGVFETGIREVDNLSIEISLEATQKLLATESLDSLVVLFKEDEGDILKWHDRSLRNYQADLEERLKQVAPNIEIQNWMDLAPGYKSVKSLYDTMFSVIRILFICLIVLNTSNILIMSVLERTREIGTMRAIGFSRFRMGVLFALEGVWLGVVGGLLGCVFGLFGGFMVNLLGFTWAPPGSTVAYPIKIFLEAEAFVGVFFLMLFVTVVSSLAAALKAFRMPVVESLRAT